MKKLIPLIVTIALILSVTNCLAKEPSETVDGFFTMVKAGKISDAFDKLFIGSEIPYLQPRQIQVLQEQTSDALRMYGDVVGVEKIREEKIGKSVERFLYVLKLEKAPLVWEFYFYMPKDKWFISKVSFNDQFHLLLRLE